MLSARFQGSDMQEPCPILMLIITLLKALEYAHRVSASDKKVRRE